MEAFRQLFAVPAAARRLEEELGRLVALPGSTADPTGCRRAQEYLARRLTALGFTTAFGPGGTLRAMRSGRGPRILVVGHVDTVYPPEEPFRGLRVVTEEGQRYLVGPGALDMKGGLVVLLAALEGLAALGVPAPPLTVLLTRDEERGSPAGGAAVTAVAREHDLCLVLEPGFDRPEGTTVVVARAGMARVEVRVEGREAHAGNARGEGLSAVAAAARLVAPLEALTDEGAGRLVTVCTFHGGKHINQVPGEARLGLDVRYRSAAAGEALLEAVRAVAAARPLTDPRTGRTARAQVRVLTCKPPMPRLPGVEPFLQELRGAARTLGLSLVPTARDGTSDGNFAAAAGTPTLDGLGAVGRDMHVTGRERVRASSLSERARLLAAALAAWAKET